MNYILVKYIIMHATSSKNEWCIKVTFDYLDEFERGVIVLCLKQNEDEYDFN